MTLYVPPLPFSLDPLIAEWLPVAVQSKKVAEPCSGGGYAVGVRASRTPLDKARTEHARLGQCSGMTPERGLDLVGLTVDPRRPAFVRDGISE
jgi:hypothetical protein